jgi:hypothetical protein
MKPKMKKMSAKIGRRRRRYNSVKKRGGNGGGGTPKTKTPKTKTPKTKTPKTEKKKTTTQKTPTVTVTTFTETVGNKTHKTPKTDDILKISLHYLFTFISDIHKWDDNIDDVVDSYISMFKKSNTVTFETRSPRSPRQNGGAFSFPFKKYATWLMHTVVGKFDSPCNIVISSIALSTYAIMAYTFIQSMQKHNFDVSAATADETYIYSLATPVKYVLYHYFPSVHEFQEQIFIIFDDYIRHVFELFSERFSITLASQNPSKAVMNLLRSIYYDGNLYNLLIVKPVSCILRYKINSCNRLC